MLHAPQAELCSALRRHPRSVHGLSVVTQSVCVYVPLRSCRLTGTHVVMLVCLSVCMHPRALQAHWNSCDADADYDAGLSVCMYLGRPCRLTRTHLVILLIMMLVCLCVRTLGTCRLTRTHVDLLCWSVCVYVPGEDLQQRSQKAYNEEIHADPGLSVCKYLGTPCSSFTRKHTRMTLMLILICLCVCT